MTGETFIALILICWFFWRFFHSGHWQVDIQQATEADFEEKQRQWEEEHGEDQEDGVEEAEIITEDTRKQKKPAPLYIPKNAGASVVAMGDGRWRITVDDIEVEE